MTNLQQKNKSSLLKKAMSNKINLYIEQVLRKHLNGYKPSATTTLSDQSGTVKINAFGNALFGSELYCDTTDPLVHFTSIDNAKNILASGSINLSSLKTSTDKNEIIRNLHLFNDFKYNSNSDDFLQNNILNLSMTKFPINELIINKNFKTIQYLFNNYGKNFPIGLVFDFSDNSQNEWFTYHLMKVQYSKTAPSILESIVEDTKKWSYDNNFQIYDLHDAIIPLLACFKESQYQIENEIRLVKVPIDSLTNFNNHPIFNEVYWNNNLDLINTQKIYFNKSKFKSILDSLVLPEPYKEFMKKNTPSPTLTKVIIPYSPDENYQINKSSIVLTRNQLKYVFDSFLYDVGLKHTLVEFIEFNVETNAISFHK